MSNLYAMSWFQQQINQLYLFDGDGCTLIAWKTEFFCQMEAVEQNSDIFSCESS